MPGPYKPLAFANEFIVKAQPHGAEHMKLQKLVYCAYGWWLVYHDEPILSEAPQVWRHGPVFKSLYHVLKTFGRTPITTIQSEGPFDTPPRVDDQDAETCQLIAWIWARYGRHDAFYLSNLTHRVGSPWYQVAQQHNFRVPFDTEIPDDVIKRHYQYLRVQSWPSQ